MFGILGYSNTSRGRFNAQEVIYIVVSIGACLMITMMKMSIREIIDLNGAFIGCIFAYLIPAAMHIRCLYFNKNRVAISERAVVKE